MRANWNYFQNVLPKLGPQTSGYALSQKQIDGIIEGKFGYIEKVLLAMKRLISHRPPSSSLNKNSTIVLEDKRSRDRFLTHTSTSLSRLAATKESI